MKTPLNLHVLSLESRDCPAVTIRLDYTYDTANFFGTQARRDAMRRAADIVGNRLNDTLAAITPDALHTWRAVVLNPFTSQQMNIDNITVNANELVVYVAGGSLPGSAIGIASSGQGFSTSINFDNWSNTIKGRGQAGALSNPASDYSTWGGFIGFDSGINWNFSTALPTASQNDFQSVALHELLHMLGYGLGLSGVTTSYERYVTNNTFIGPNAQAVFGGPVPLNDAEGDHLASGVTSGGQTALMVPALLQGTRRGITPLDDAILQDMGWQVTVPPPPPPPAGTGPVRVVVGSGRGTAPTIAGLNSSGGTVWTNTVFTPSATGGVRVASADFNADGVLDIVIGTGPGTTALVQLLNGKDRTVLHNYSPFGTFTGGVNIAAGDITGDGTPDILVSPDQGGGPRVRILNGKSFTQVSDFFGIDDVNFRGGARVAAGDLNGDNVDDLVVSAGFGGGPRIALYSGKTLTTNGGPKFAGDFFAFEQSLRNGSFITVGDLDLDGQAELIAGGGPGGGPRVSVFSGAQLVQGKQVRIADFFAGDSTKRGGVRLAVIDRTGDGIADLATGDGEGAGSRVSVYNGPPLVGNASPTPVFSFDYFFNTGGIFVG